jgi:RNA polymerase sigma factor (sigma-70 family)
MAMNVTETFEQHRAHLRGVAFHMLSSPSEAEDAVQEAWLRLHRAEPAEVANLRGWLTTVVARICLDMLRARKSRREEPLDPGAPGPATPGPEQEAALADSVGVALFLVLEKLDPAERLAFVLHDIFAVPFDEIAAIVGRTPAAARQLASRGRRRVRGEPEHPAAQLAGERVVVARFLAALRAGDMAGLIAVLDPEVTVRRGDGGEFRGAATWAKGAIAFAAQAAFVQPALVDGAAGLILVRGGKLLSALRFGFGGDRITSAEIINAPARLEAIDLAVLE